MSTNRRVIIVLAYDHKEYRRKVSELRDSREESVATVFANSPGRLRGIEADEIVRCDGFWKRDDAVDIAKIAQNRLK